MERESAIIRRRPSLGNVNEEAVTSADVAAAIENADNDDNADGQDEKVNSASVTVESEIKTKEEERHDLGTKGYLVDSQLSEVVSTTKKSSEDPVAKLRIEIDTAMHEVINSYERQILPPPPQSSSSDGESTVNSFGNRHVEGGNTNTVDASVSSKVKGDGVEGDEEKYVDKINDIIACLDPTESHVVDLWQLRQFSLTDGGLVTAELRRVAWPKLAGIHKTFEVAKDSFTDNGSGWPKQEDIDVVMRDVGRSVWHEKILSKRTRDDTGGATSKGLNYRGSSSSAAVVNSPLSALSNTSFDLLMDSSFENDTPRSCPSRGSSKKRTASSRDKEEQHLLASVILSVLQNTKGDLHYYQGFHDLCALVVINVEDCGIASSVLSNIGKSHLRDAMSSDFTKLMTAIKLSLFPLIGILDPEIHDYIMMSEVEPYFSLSWIITWFSHDIRDIARASRLFDAFIASHPLLPVYVSVAVLLHPHNRISLLSTECEFSAIHTVLANMPLTVPPDFDQPSDFDQYCIDTAIQYMEKVHPKHLISLSRRYRKGLLKPLIGIASEISLFGTPPAWCFAAAAPTERVLDEEAKALRKLSRKLRIVRKKDRKKMNVVPKKTASDIGPGQLCSKPATDYKPNTVLYRKALIASGLGSTSRKKKPILRRKSMIYGSVVVVAAVFGVYRTSTVQDVILDNSGNNDTLIIESELINLEYLQVHGKRENTVHDESHVATTGDPSCLVANMKDIVSVAVVSDGNLGIESSTESGYKITTSGVGLGEFVHAKSSITELKNENIGLLAGNADDSLGEKKVDQSSQNNKNVGFAAVKPNTHNSLKSNAIVHEESLTDKPHRSLERGWRDTKQVQVNQKPRWLEKIHIALGNDAEIVYI